jgi:hypothetical protein
MLVKDPLPPDIGEGSSPVQMDWRVSGPCILRGIIVQNFFYWTIMPLIKQGPDPIQSIWTGEDPSPPISISNREWTVNYFHPNFNDKTKKRNEAFIAK